jgi:hypothetical protein
VAKYGSNSVTINVDNSGGTPVDMTQHTLDINDVEIESILEESHAFGDSWFESLATGVRRMAPIVMGGLYDDTSSSGPNAMYATTASGPSETLRTWQCVYGSTKSTSVETLIAKYGRKLGRAALHKYSVTLQPSGAVTEA